MSVKNFKEFNSINENLDDECHKFIENLQDNVKHELYKHVFGEMNLSGAEAMEKMEEIMDEFFESFSYDPPQ